MLLFIEQQIANNNNDEIIKELKVMTPSKRRLVL